MVTGKIAMNNYDLIVIGAGPAGMLAAITAARAGRSVLLLEKLPRPGAKLMATGGGRCNLTNTLEVDDFLSRFGRQGRFMIPALKAFDRHSLVKFFADIGVECHALDGYRIFPVTHNSLTVVSALQKELEKSGVKLIQSDPVKKLQIEDNHVSGVLTAKHTYNSARVIIATGGLGYPSLGSDGDGFTLAASAGHKITPLHPAMLPLHTEEKWVANCRADTIAKVEMRINLSEAGKLRAKGDLIFTSNGIAGPVVLDFAREITPLLDKHGKIPLLLNLTKGKNEEELRLHLNSQFSLNKSGNVLSLLSTLLPAPLARELCRICNIDVQSPYGKIPGALRDRLIKILAWTPLTVTGHDGYRSAMITRGGVSLKEIAPETLQSKLVKGLFFCGEVVDLDGPCGGFNLQWCFSSGFLAGTSAASD